MNEIEKMYMNAGIVQKRCKDYSCIVCDKNKDCNKYPPFTAEKVLKVIVFFLNKGIELDFSVLENTKISVENFKECIAQMGAKYWQDLTEEEKQQVKGILE